MKKLLAGLSLSAALFLAACGGGAEENMNETTSANTEATQQADNEQLSQSEWMEQQSEADIEADQEELNGVIGNYVNEDMNEDGYYTVDFEGFELQVAPKLIETASDTGEMTKAIKLDMIGENGTDMEVDYGGGTTIVTDTQEQLSPDFDIMSDGIEIMGQNYYPDVIKEGYSVAPLKNSENTPQSITVILDPPYEVTEDGVDPINGVLGEEQTVEFDLEQ